MADKIPIEIWSSIAVLACTDGGRTGRSLSLSCRFLHSVMQPLRLHTVALFGVELLHSFTQCLRLSCLSSPDHPPEIRHLFVAIPIQYWEPRATPKEQIANFNEDIVAVMTHAAPTLRTLTVRDPYTLDIGNSTGMRAGMPLPALDTLHFPALEALTMQWHASPSRTNAHERFPRLTRLHVVRPSMSMQMWEGLMRYAPGVQHLRFSELVAKPRVAPFLRTVLDIPFSQPDDLLGPPPLPSEVLRLSVHSEQPRALEVREKMAQLQSVCLQAFDVYGMEPQEARANYPHVGMCAGFRRLARDCSADAMAKRVIMMPDGKPGYELEEALQDWVSMVEGGEGPWRSLSTM